MKRAERAGEDVRQVEDSDSGESSQGATSYEDAVVNVGMGPTL